MCIQYLLSMGFHEADFGISVGDHDGGFGAFNVIFKQVTFKKSNGKENIIVSSNEFSERYTNIPIKDVVFTLHDDIAVNDWEDYHSDTHTITVSEMDGDDDNVYGYVYELVHSISFVGLPNVKIQTCYGCGTVIGFGPVGDDGDKHSVTVEYSELRELMKLFKKLKKERRIDRSCCFKLVGNCCS